MYYDLNLRDLNFLENSPFQQCKKFLINAETVNNVYVQFDKLNLKYSQMTKKEEFDNQVQSKEKKLVSYQKSTTFLQSQPDLYLILGYKIYPLHRSIAKQSQYLSRNMDEEQKTLILTEQYQSQIFQTVLRFLYSYQLDIDKFQDVEKLLSLAKKLQIQKIKGQIQSQLQKKFEDYSIFKLYKIAIEYELHELLDKCNHQFMSMSFQQLNINRHDILEINKEIFQQIIRNHQKLKTNKIITGLGTDQLRSLIAVYNQHNKLQIKTEQLLQIKDQYYQINSCSSEKNSTGQLRKNGTTHFSTKKTSELQKQENPKSCQMKIPTLDNYDFNKCLKQFNQKKKNEKKQIIRQEIEQAQKIKQMKEKFLDLECVASPVVELWEIQQKVASFQNLSFQQDHKFIFDDKQTNNQPFGLISERNSSQQEDRDEQQYKEIDQSLNTRNMKIINKVSSFDQELPQQK